MNAAMQRFYAKYENCTAPPRDARAIYRVVGARNWREWCAEFVTLFVPTTKVVGTVTVGELDAALLKTAKAEMLNRTYFMKQPWPSLHRQSTVMMIFLKYLGVVDYSRAGGMQQIIKLVMENEQVIADLSYFFGDPLPAMNMSKDAIRLFFDHLDKKEIDTYLEGLVQRAPQCRSLVYVNEATYTMVVRLPHARSKVGVPILIGSKLASVYINE